MKKHLFIAMLLITGCSTRELLKTKSTNSKLTESGFIFENDTIKVTYGFWAEDGIMSMRIYNKLSVPIFIDWKISNFINNDNNFQYWYDVQNSKSTTNGTQYYGIKNKFYTANSVTGTPFSAINSITNSKTERPDRITSITPHSDILKQSYSLFPIYDDRTAFYVDAGDYDYNNSPIKFRNYLALSMDESFKSKFYVDNQFYVSHAEIIKSKDFWNGRRDKDGHTYFICPYKNPTYFYSEKLLIQNGK